MLFGLLINKYMTANNSAVIQSVRTYCLRNIINPRRRVVGVLQELWSLYAITLLDYYNRTCRQGGDNL